MMISVPFATKEKPCKWFIFLLQISLLILSGYMAIYLILFFLKFLQMKLQSTKIHPFAIIIAGEHLVLAFRRLRLTDTSGQYQWWLAISKFTYKLHISRKNSLLLVDRQLPLSSVGPFPSWRFILFPAPFLHTQLLFPARGFFSTVKKRLLRCN